MAATKPGRNPDGTFATGNQINPTGAGGGRPPKNPILKTACKDLTQDCLEVLKSVMLTGSGAERVAACKLILAYGHGQPSAKLEITRRDVREMPDDELYARAEQILTEEDEERGNVH